MKLLVLGAAGKTGRQIVSQALAAGHEVVAFVRSADELPPQDHLQVIVGDAEKPADLVRAAQGIQAVVSALGHTNVKHSAPLTSAVQALSGALPPNTKYISLTGFGVPDAKDPSGAFSGKLLNLMVKCIPGGMFNDGLRHVEALRHSQLDYTAVRAAVLTNGAAKGYQLGYFALTPSDSIARADVAAAMLDCLANSTWSRQAPMIKSA